MSSQKTQDNYNYVFDIIIKQKNTNVTVHVSMNVNETNYLGHQVDKAISTYNKSNCRPTAKGVPQSKAQATTTSTTESVTEPAPHTAGSLAVDTRHGG